MTRPKSRPLASATSLDQGEYVPMDGRLALKGTEENTKAGE